MSPKAMSTQEKARVAKDWVAAHLSRFGFEVHILSRKKNLLRFVQDKRVVTIRTKACFSDLGVPFTGFKFEDNDFIILVDLRKQALQSDVWVVPTEFLDTEMERPYDGARYTFYWKDGRKRNYGWERKLAPYRNAWTLLSKPMP